MKTLLSARLSSSHAISASGRGRSWRRSKPLGSFSTSITHYLRSASSIFVLARLSLMQECSCKISRKEGAVSAQLAFIPSSPHGQCSKGRIVPGRYQGLSLLASQPRCGATCPVAGDLQAPEFALDPDADSLMISCLSGRGE